MSVASAKMVAPANIPTERLRLRPVTMDDATSEHYSMFFVEQEGTFSSFEGIKQVILEHGLFCSLYTDRGSHYWNTEQAGGKVDKTMVEGAAAKLGVELDVIIIPDKGQEN